MNNYRDFDMIESRPVRYFAWFLMISGITALGTAMGLMISLLSLLITGYILESWADNIILSVATIGGLVYFWIALRGAVLMERDVYSKHTRVRRIR